MFDIQRFINLAKYYYSTSMLGQSGLRLSPFPILASSVGNVREKVLRTSALLYKQTFINVAIHTLRYDTSHTNRKCDRRTNRSTGKATCYPKGKSGIEELERDWNCRAQKGDKRSEVCRRNLQDMLEFQGQGRKNSQSPQPANGGRGTQERQASQDGEQASRRKSFFKLANRKAPQVNFSLFLFSNYNVLIILQALDDICLQINPLLLGALLS